MHVSAAITCFAFIVVLLDKLVVPILRDFDLTYAPSSRWTSGFFWQPCPAARAQRARPAPTLARSVRQVDFVICLYTTLPVRGEVCTTHAHGYLARRSAPIDVESLRYFTAIFVMNLDLLCLWNAARNLFYRQIWTQLRTLLKHDFLTLKMSGNGFYSVMFMNKPYYLMVPT